MSAQHPNNDSKHDHHEHHVMEDKTAFRIWGALLVFTVITVLVAKIDMGVMNFPVAMLVASIKASLVAIFFMGLKHDHKENIVIFLTSFVFALIFIVLTSMDIFFRGDVYVKGPLVPESSQRQAKFKKAWIVTDDIKKHGKELYVTQCVSCHGEAGLGNGVAAAALNPKPRNFTQDAEWKNGRKPSQVYGTLTKGLNTMPAFGTLPPEDRWALAHYILSLGPTIPADSDADLVKVGVDPKSDGGGADTDKTLPLEFAIDQMTQGS